MKSKYSIEIKLKCLELEQIIGIGKTSNITGINKKCIKNWRKNESFYTNKVDVKSK